MGVQRKQDKGGLTWSVSALPMSGPMTDESSKSAECAKESWAILETDNLRNDLFHGDDYLDPVSTTIT